MGSIAATSSISQPYGIKPAKTPSGWERDAVASRFLAGLCSCPGGRKDAEAEGLPWREDEAMQEA